VIILVSELDDALKHILTFLQGRRYTICVFLPFSIALLIGFKVDSMIWSAVEIHLGLVLSCTPAFKALIQRFLPGFFGSTRATNVTQFSTRLTLNARGGSYVLQSRNGDETKFGATSEADVTELAKSASQEHIIDDVLMATLEHMDSIHSPPKASIDGSALPGC
jgi:hypothetical protein